MEDEKGLLKRDLENAKTKEAINDVIESAKDYGHDDIIASANEKLQALKKQVEDTGGDAVKAEELTEDVNKRIGQEEAEVARKVAEISGEKVEDKEVTEKKKLELENKIKYLESLLEFDAKLAELQQKAQQIFAEHRNEIDVLTTDSPEVKEEKNKKYIDLIIKPMNLELNPVIMKIEQQYGLKNKDEILNIIAKIQGPSTWAGKFSDRANTIIEETQRQIQELEPKS